MVFYNKAKYFRLLNELTKGLSENLITSKQFITFILRLRIVFSHIWINEVF